MMMELLPRFISKFFHTTVTKVNKGIKISSVVVNLCDLCVRTLPS